MVVGIYLKTCDKYVSVWVKIKVFFMFMLKGLCGSSIIIRVQNERNKNYISQNILLLISNTEDGLWCC